MEKRRERVWETERAGAREGVTVTVTVRVRLLYSNGKWKWKKRGENEIMNLEETKEKR